MKTRIGTTSSRIALVLCAAALPACGGQLDVDHAGQGRVAFTLSSSAASGALTTAMTENDSDDGDHACALPKAASVTFSAVEARALDGTLVDVTIALPVTIDLLSLVGKQATLPVGFLPAGTYDQFVVVMKGLELTLTDGTKIAVTPPGGGWTAVIGVAEPFTVVADATTTVHLQFRAERSFACGLGRWAFHPVFDCHR